MFFATLTLRVDMCQPAGTGTLYGLFSVTGSAYRDSILGITRDESHVHVNRSVRLGEGIPSALAVHIGAEGSDLYGAGSGAGCQGQQMLMSRASTGATVQRCVTSQHPWSRTVSWITRRD